MTQKQQKDILRRFKKGEFNVLVCTSIGEEGLDIGEVDCIICYDTTSSPIKRLSEGWVEQVEKGMAVSYCCSVGMKQGNFNEAMEDYAKLQKMIMHNLVEYTKSNSDSPRE